MPRVKLLRRHGVVREGERITLPAGVVIEVSEAQYRAFRDQMELVAELTLEASIPPSAPTAPPAGGDGTPENVPTAPAPDAGGVAAVPPSDAGAPEASSPTNAPEQAPEPAPVDATAPEGPGFASPAAERRAAEENVSLEQLVAAGAPSGQSGYTVADVAAVAEARTTAQA